MRILEDAKEFKKEYWIIAVGIGKYTTLTSCIYLILNYYKYCLMV